MTLRGDKLDSVRQVLACFAFVDGQGAIEGAEKCACGVGFAVSTRGEARHELVERGLAALAAVEHRGGCLADGSTGDGAGIMTEIPFSLFGITAGETAVGSLFVSLPMAERRLALDAVSDVFRLRGLEIEATREVPTDTSVLGRQARDSLPTILHLFIRRPEFCRTEGSFGALLYQAKQATRTRLTAMGFGRTLYFTSLSVRTIIYKALVRADDLPAFYPDLRDPRYESRFSLFHRRFSTNTVTSWDKAQPFRMIAHNGEINTIEGNRAWAFARQHTLGLPTDELLTLRGTSDSGNFNEMVEALRWRSSIPHLSEILAIMVPPVRVERSPFYEFWGRAVEPWDGPAFLAFSDGELVGARLDRNGFRPGRWMRTLDTFYLASEAGLFGVPDDDVIQKGALSGGSGVHVHLATGEVHHHDPSESRENRHATFDPRLEPLVRSSGAALDLGAEEELSDRFGLFRYASEDLDEVLIPMIRDGKEPIGSMGDTARPAILSDQPRAIGDFFYQSFAQVTNPPLDHLRERFVTDLSTILGKRPNVFAPKTLLPLPPGLLLPSPVLEPEDLAALSHAGELSQNQGAFESVIVACTFPRARGREGLEEALCALESRVLAAIRGGCSVVILSDRGAKLERPPIPSLLALSAAVVAMSEAGHRLDASVVVDAGDVKSIHDLAALAAFGAAAVCPRLAFRLADESTHASLTGLTHPERRARLRRAFEEGLLKVMSKMGISTFRGYQGSRLFTPLGLGPKILARYFGGLPSPIGGYEIEDLADKILTETAAPESPRPHYYLREHNRGERGERHSMTSSLTKRIHEVVKDHQLTLERWPDYEAYLADLEEHQPVNLRHLLSFSSDGPALAVEDVEPRQEILRRFGSGAMSFGAISAESQRDLIHAMKRVGGRSGSGEGGENPFFYVDGTTASVKQIASGRFGVSARYLMSGDEIEIKIAQGAKPGEGGQLMGIKVDATIAEARHSPIGVDLISPPPLHDIYSIEDLRELIYELKQLKPGVRVVVKLVSGANVGTIAAGVVKAGADVIQISGGDGGTGAASLSSMRHAGLPFELGLAEVHATLLAQGLRENVVLRVDGGLSSGKDVVMAALLGGEEFGFGKLLLIAEGCIMARVCQKNTCPRGIATHDPKYKAKYRGSPEDVVTFLSYLAEDVRRHLARLGVARLELLVGRADLLVSNPRHRDCVESRRLDLTRLTTPGPHARGFRAPALVEPTGRLNQRVVEDAAPWVESGSPVQLQYPIRSTDRAVPATLAGVIALRPRPEAPPIVLRFEGSAGQGFAAFMVAGMEISLVGEANDSVGKSMSGGVLAIHPPPKVRYSPERSSIIGNAALYGATGGRAFFGGLAGDRFAVRNSGADAVVDGVGLHACEYMTNGRVVILGAASNNIGAGMTGGVLFIRRAEVQKLHTGYVGSRALEADDLELLRGLVEEHAERTHSRAAFALLAQPSRLAAEYVIVEPKRS